MNRKYTSLVFLLLFIMLHGQINNKIPAKINTEKKVYRAIGLSELAEKLGGSQEEVVLEHMASVRDYSKPLDFRSREIYEKRAKTTKNAKEKAALEKMLKEDLELEKVLKEKEKQNELQYQQKIKIEQENQHKIKTEKEYKELIIKGAGISILILVLFGFGIWKLFKNT